MARLDAFTAKIKGAVLSIDAGVGFFGWFTAEGETTLTSP
jgi:hypothetical protein